MTDQHPIDQRIQAWKSRLLDLSRRSRLLYFKPSRYSTIQITQPGAQALFEALVVGERKLRFPLAVRLQSTEESPEQSEAEAPKPAPYQIRPGDLEVDLEPADLNPRLYRLRRDYRTGIVEQGVHTLFLALGLLRWKETEASEEYVDAPVVLAPVDLERDSNEKPYELHPADEDVALNPTLAFKMKTDFGISLPELPEELEDFDVPAYLGRITEQVEGLGWHVADEVWLGRFSFEKLVMYRDLEEHRHEAREHPVVSALAGLSAVADSIEYSEPCDRLDERSNSPETFPVLDADSSQVETLARVQAGEDLVVIGPPGTGKSQTISNIIAQALRGGKRVLFVSEKMAALDVVHGRLREVGLGPAVLEAHSHRASKRAVIEELGRTLFHDHGSALPQVSSQFDSLIQMVRELNEYVTELHQPRDRHARSAFQVVGRLAALNEAEYMNFALPFSSVLERTHEEESEIESALRELTSVPEVLNEYERHPFRGWEVADLTIEQTNEIRSLLERISSVARRLSQHGQGFAARTGLEPPASVDDSRRAADVARLLSVAPAVKAGWFDEPESSLAHLREAARHGRDMTEAHRDVTRQLEGLSGLGVLELPLAELRQRFATEYRGPLRLLKSEFRADMRLLKSAWTAPQGPSYGRAVRALELATDHKAGIDRMEARSAELERLFGDGLFNWLDTAGSRLRGRQAATTDELLPGLRRRRIRRGR